MSAQAVSGVRARVRGDNALDGSVRGEDAQLLIPSVDAEDPELSVVIPALNEQTTISEFVRWCHEGMAQAGVTGEVVIVDSSTDMTADRALEAGARVLRVPRRGLGRAYKDALPYARGRYILMGTPIAHMTSGAWSRSWRASATTTSS